MRTFLPAKTIPSTGTFLLPAETIPKVEVCTPSFKEVCTPSFNAEDRTRTGTNLWFAGF